MKLANVEIKIPSGMVSYVERLTPEMELKRNAMILYAYIQDNTISYGKAAELLGINKYDLIELYELMGVPYYNLNMEEIEEDLENYRSLKGAQI